VTVDAACAAWNKLTAEVVVVQAVREVAFLEVEPNTLDGLRVMYADQAGWHGAKDLRIPDNVLLLALPAYSPERRPRSWAASARTGRGTAAS
jgi:hypothetical protein